MWDHLTKGYHFGRKRSNKNQGLSLERVYRKRILEEHDFRKEYIFRRVYPLFFGYRAALRIERDLEK